MKVQRTTRLAASAALVLLAAARYPPDARSHNPITTTVQFNREVSKILGQKCVQCHAPGGMAVPFTTYAESRPWAQAIKEEILARRMPPWPAERGFGEFANDVGLTGRELEFLVSWVDGGAPQGDGEPPAHVDHSGHWMLGAPDAVVKGEPGVPVGADAPPGFTRVTVATGLEKDTWVRAIDVKPGDKRVARAAFVGLERPARHLGGWTPWQSSIALPDGVAVRLPARARLTLDVLYRGAGEPVTDRPAIGLYFAPAPRAALTNVLVRASTDAAQPTRARGIVPLQQAATLIGARIDMSAGARSLELRATRPDGAVQVLLWLTRIDPGWATPLVFREPIALPPGTTLEATGHFGGNASDAAPRTLTVALTAYGGATAAPASRLRATPR